MPPRVLASCGLFLAGFSAGSLFGSLYEACGLYSLLARKPGDPARAAFVRILHESGTN